MPQHELLQPCPTRRAARPACSRWRAAPPRPPPPSRPSPRRRPPGCRAPRTWAARRTGRRRPTAGALVAASANLRSMSAMPPTSVPRARAARVGRQVPQRKQRLVADEALAEATSASSAGRSAVDAPTAAVPAELQRAAPPRGRQHVHIVAALHFGWLDQVGRRRRATRSRLGRVSRGSWTRELRASTSPSEAFSSLSSRFRRIRARGNCGKSLNGGPEGHPHVRPN